MLIRVGDHAFRYRVVRFWTTIPGDTEADEAAYGDEPREFKTLAGAEKYRDEIVATGHKALLQVGVVRWMSHDEAEAEFGRRPSFGHALSCLAPRDGSPCTCRPEGDADA